MKSVIGAALAVLLASTALAKPPPGTDLNGPVHHWFARQYPRSGAWCCNISDGHVLKNGDWKMGKTNFWVRIEGAWYKVPAHALVDPKGGPNPTGQPIVWYIYYDGAPHITCFCPGYMF